MTALLDTSAVLGLVERRNPQLREIVAGLDHGLLRSSIVTAELLHGVEAAHESDRHGRRATLDRYLRITTAPDDPPGFETLLDPYARLSSFAGSLRPRVGQNDRWILAEAGATAVSMFVTEDLAQARLARAWFDDDTVEVVCVAPDSTPPPT